ncbi:MAG TPA: ABC transporter substrate-binding protein [Candidatus Methylomirabilis sp.]|nr:ABC transporter substrate-binding protein [Candidatus Methylomirabilis sp.]
MASVNPQQRMMTRRDALRVLGLTAAVAGLPTGARAAAAPTGEVKIGLAAEPNTFDPHLVVGRNTQIFIVNVYDGLTARDGQGHLAPALSESWKRLNPTTWQFGLRKGVKFHNGDDFNADSVKFTLDRAINPETKATVSSEMSTIAGTEIVDAFTVNVVTKTPDFLLPVRLGELYGLMLSPKHTIAAGKEAIAVKPNGTGPFKLVAWTKNERLVLEANETYWRGAPKVKTIVVRPILEDAARIAALQAGEVDLIAPVPPVRIAELQRNDKLVVKTIAAPRIFHVTIDVRKPPFDNVKVRQALNYAVDVNAILKTLYFGHGTRLATVVDKGALGYDPSIPPYPYDPGKAKALLAEAGYPNGFEVEFDSFTGSIADHSKPAEAIVGYLQKVGIRAKANVFEFSTFGPRRVQNKTAPLFIYSIGDAYLEPSWVIRWLTQGGLGMHYKNPKLDEMLARIEATDDPKKRVPQYSEVQKLIKDEAPFIFLYQADAAFGMSARVDYTPRPDETQWLYPMTLKG